MISTKINPAMKNIRLTTVKLLILVLSAIVLSCEKNSEDPPVITNVRYTDPVMADIKLDTSNGAALGRWVVIQGSHFATTQMIYFNGVEASFNPTHVTDNNIVVQVPENTPNLATHPDSLVIDETRVATSYGEATYGLRILPPPPTVDIISNEFANEGDRITLWGRYFYYVENVIFPGGIPGTDIAISADAKTLQVTVPANVTESGELTVRSQSGDSFSGIRSRFNDTTGIFIDCEDPGIQANPAGVQFYDETQYPVIKNCRGMYMFAFALNVVPASWWVVETALETNADSSFYSRLTYPDYPDQTPVEKLELRFEANVKFDWASGFYEMAFLQDAGWTEAYRIFWQPWSWFPEATLQTDGWRTFAIPIGNFTVDAAGETAPLVYSDIKGEPFNINFKNPMPEQGAVTIPILQMAFDNFRIVMIP
jgi:hypothetical protein